MKDEGGPAIMEEKEGKGLASVWPGATLGCC